jgi:membrane associated rhomboid family serine protease
MLPIPEENPTKRPPVVTPLLIAANVAVFLAWQNHVGLQHSVVLAGLVPRELNPISNPGLTHLFTSMFMHGSLWHLLGNMWFLWVFGDNVEDDIGRIRFLGLYLLCGVAAAAAHLALNPNSMVPIIGASGAISGVLGASLVLQPTARVKAIFWFGVIRLPAWFYLLLWIGFQVYAMTQTGKLGYVGVAYGAHVGGFVTGFILAFFKRGENPEAA